MAIKIIIITISNVVINYDLSEQYNLRIYIGAL
jgi:hypothetical protein